MHELGLCESVLDAVVRRAQARRVTRVVVRAGVLHRISPDAFQQAFALVAAGTVAEAAETSIVDIPVVVHCHDCGALTDSDDVFAVCPGCGSSAVEATGGDELVLESIEYAPAEPVDEVVRA